MKIKVKSSKKFFYLKAENTSKRFLVDRKFKKDVTKFTWRYVPLQKVPQATVAKNTRMLLHRYVAQLANKKWREIYFSNGNRQDCRLGNLRPYDRVHDGARRKQYKNNKSGKKGVYFRKNTGMWHAIIKFKRKLTYLGHYSSMDEAAKAYDREYRKLHGNKKA